MAHIPFDPEFDVRADLAAPKHISARAAFFIGCMSAAVVMMIMADGLLLKLLFT